MSDSKNFHRKHFLNTAELSADEVRFLLSSAKAFSNELQNPYAERDIPLLEGLTLVHLFFENSTRTWASFDLAARKLGAQTLQFAVGSSSVSKGETLLDTAKNIMAMRCDGFIVRHASAGSSTVLSKQVSVPVINAGDGFHEHPSQALLDLYTMQEHIGDVRGKHVVIIGDIAHSRVARSNIHLLKKMGAKISVCGPPTLLPPLLESLGVEKSYRPEDLLGSADVVMLLRIQLERQNRMQIPSLGEYTKFWGLNKERAKLLKKNAIIMHPGPINRGVEIDPEVADGPRSVILDQVQNGIGVRMAILASTCVPDRLGEWLRQKRVHA